jgi:hypothetical protein
VRKTATAIVGETAVVIKAVTVRAATAQKHLYFKVKEQLNAYIF